MEDKVVTYKAKLGEKVINKVNLLTMIKSIQIFLAIATHYENEFWQMDVKITYLKGNLTKEVYKIQP